MFSAEYLAAHNDAKLRRSKEMKRGFTLIELLVVIAIIAILAAILFPVFARARDRARMASCTSNMRQIGVAAMMYAQDYDEHFAPHYAQWISGDWTTRYFGFYDALAPYTMNEQIYICPSGRYTTDSRRADFPNESGFFGREFTASYGVVCHHSHINHWGTGIWAFSGLGHSLADFERPAEKILVLEMRTHMGGNPANFGFTEDGVPLQMGDDGRVGNMMYRHNRMMNAAFADGHVKTIPQLTSPDPLVF